MPKQLRSDQDVKHLFKRMQNFLGVATAHRMVCCPAHVNNEVEIRLGRRLQATAAMPAGLVWTVDEDESETADGRLDLHIDTPCAKHACGDKVLARVVVTWLQSQGYRASWNGRSSSCPVLELDAKKPPRKAQPRKAPVPRPQVSTFTGFGRDKEEDTMRRLFFPQAMPQEAEEESSNSDSDSDKANA
jgi:hypothetical protein